tara:strand:- start:73937 stop:74227 length:291 start_codon:yes stop_codon:yes gene_type:complete
MAGMHPEEIKAAVRMTGITLTELSLRAGLGESNVRQALFFQHCPSGERAIIDHLGLEPHAIWPNRYDRDGNRIIGRNNINTTKSKSAGHRQKGAVA